MKGRMRTLGETGRRLERQALKGRLRDSCVLKTFSGTRYRMNMHLAELITGWLFLGKYMEREKRVVGNYP